MLQPGQVWAAKRNPGPGWRIYYSRRRSLSAAQRELGEETGYQAENWFNLGQYLVDPNRGIATGHLFLATGARQAVQPVQDDLEEQELIFLKRETLENALSNGKIQVLAWAATVALGLRVLDQQADLETKNE